MADINFKVLKHIGVLSQRMDYRKEINLISWNGGKPKIDIREWTENRTRMTKGITLSMEEVKNLKDILVDIDLSEVKDIELAEEE